LCSVDNANARQSGNCSRLHWDGTSLAITGTFRTNSCTTADIGNNVAVLREVPITLVMTDPSMLAGHKKRSTTFRALSGNTRTPKLSSKQATNEPKRKRNRVLRKIFGPKREDVTGEWRQLLNARLHNLYPSGIRLFVE
jgi:hypothetical protein